MSAALEPSAVRANRDEEGFTLVEVMAALAVFAIAGLGLMKASSENVRAARMIETRAIAAIVADNQLAQTLAATDRLLLGESRGEETMARRNWRWVQTVRETPNPLIVEINVSAQAVGPNGALEGGAVVRSAFRRSGA